MDEDDIRALTEVGNPDFYAPPWDKNISSRRTGYPLNKDIDYDRNSDEDWSEHDE